MLCALFEQTERVATMKDKRIDGGKEFDWGKTSKDYAKYRDIYPTEFYNRILAAGVALAGQKVLDIGTGTGVLPRNLYAHGAAFTGTDIAENQIKEAKLLSQQAGMDITYQCVPAEQLDFLPASFDAVTACQCFAYFRHEVVAPKLHTLLKPGGRFVVLYMEWLPFEDAIAGASENLVLQYNPAWSGYGETRHNNVIPPVYFDYFDLEKEEMYDLMVPFTRESWNGRMKACRGIGASLSEERVQAFDAEHLALLQKIAPPQFEVLHCVAMTVLKAKV